jgi:hypothetical protein
MPEWLQRVFRSVIKRALLSALVVGAILITINHGDAISRKCAICAAVGFKSA